MFYCPDDNDPLPHTLIVDSGQYRSVFGRNAAWVYGGYSLKTINIRSMGTQQMGVFYDGIQMGNAQNGQVDLGRFSLDNIEVNVPG